MIYTEELIGPGHAHPSSNQVTLERSDFRTDFRTRMKNKGFSINGSAVTLLSRQEKVLKLSVPQQYPSMVYKIMYKNRIGFADLDQAYRTKGHKLD